MSGLAGDRAYTFTLSAGNGAGANTAPVSAPADLAYPTEPVQNANNNQTNALIRVRRDRSDGADPEGCVRHDHRGLPGAGHLLHRPESDTTSTVWDRIRSSHGDGHLSDTLMRTPKPDPQLCTCDG